MSRRIFSPPVLQTVWLLRSSWGMGCHRRVVRKQGCVAPWLTSVELLRVCVCVCVCVCVYVSLGVRSWTCVCCPAFLQSELQPKANEANMCGERFLTHMYTHVPRFPSLSFSFHEFSPLRSCLLFTQLPGSGHWAQLGQTSGQGKEECVNEYATGSNGHMK